MRIFKRTFLLLLVIGALLASAGFFFTQLFGDDIKNGLVTYLNKQINTKVNAESIDLSVWGEFPQTSVEFTNLRVQESIPGSSDNLAVFEEVLFVLDLWEILKGNYVIEKILVENGRINMAIREDYSRNFRIFKTSADTSEPKSPSNLSLNLKNVTLRNVQYQYHNIPQQEKISAYFQEATLRGQFQDEVFTMKADANSLLEAFEIQETTYVKNKPVDLQCKLEIDKKKGRYALQEGNVRIADAQFKLSGKVMEQEKGQELDLTFEGRKNRLKTLLALVPEKYRQTFATYHGNGEFFFNADLTGLVSAKSNPRLAIEFGIEDGTITKEGVQENLQEVNLKGSFTNGNQQALVSTLLKIENFKASLNDREVKGNMSLNNFTDPYLNLKVSSNVQLADAKKFLPLKDLTKLNGNLFLDAAFAGRISHLESVETVHKTNFTGDMSLREVNARSESQDTDYKDLNGNFRFNGNDLIVNNFSGFVGNSNFKLNGHLRNLASFLFLDEEKLTIDADFQSKNINLQPLLTTEYNQDSKDSVITFALPDYLVLDLGLQCDKVQYDHFKAKGVDGNVRYNEGELKLAGLSFNCMSGSMKLSGSFASRENGNLRANLDANGKGIALDQLFYQMNNFGQKTLTNNHLDGKVNTDIQFKAEWDQHFNPLYDKLSVRSDVSVKNGELNNFEPIMKLSGLIDVQELKNLDFQKLDNNIVIDDKTIQIPKMQVESNAFTMDISGKHYFDNQIKYHMRINLSEILFGEKQDYETEFGKVVHEEDGDMNLFVKMTGPASDPEMKYDRKAVAQKIKKDLKKEGKDLGKAFEKDNQQNKDKDEYELEWDDE